MYFCCCYVCFWYIVCDVKVADNHLHGRWLFTWLSLMMSMEVTNLVLSFPTRLFGWDLGWNFVSSWEVSCLLWMYKIFYRKLYGSWRERGHTRWGYLTQRISEGTSWTSFKGRKCFDCCTNRIGENQSCVEDNSGSASLLIKPSTSPLQTVTNMVYIQTSSIYQKGVQMISRAA